MAYTTHKTLQGMGQHSKKYDFLLILLLKAEGMKEKYAFVMTV